MKTKIQNTKSTPGLRVRSSNHQAEPAAASAPAPEQTPQRPPLPKISLERRRANRALSTERVIELLHTEAPSFFEVAEVVGRWVWVQFTEKQPREVTAELAELGFHWNNRRQVWQHPCGAVTEGTDGDPREKYSSYYPADIKAA